MSTPLDLSKSPWQFHLIEQYGAGCVVLTRLHHCIADGIALMGVLLQGQDRLGDGVFLDVDRHGGDPLGEVVEAAAGAGGLPASTGASALALVYFEMSPVMVSV